MTTPSKVSVGVSTVAGLLFTILGAVGTVYAAVKANDTATVVSGVGTISTALTTLAGRHAQAVALIRRVTPVAQRIVSALPEPGDELDGLPDISTHPPDAHGEHLGDPMTRGEVTA